MAARAGRSFKTAVYSQLARVGKATASPSRLELLDLLSQGPRTVEALAKQTGQTIANTSHHLQVLRGARLVDADKNGLYVTYRLADAQVGAFVLQLRLLAEARLAELDRVKRELLAPREGLMASVERVDQEELLRRVRAGAVTVLDVRPSEEYEAGHIPGAISLPVNELKTRLADLPKGRDIVAYCRGPFCVMALDAVHILRRKGLRALRMEHGIPEWRARGWRVETGRRDRQPASRAPGRASARASARANARARASARVSARP